MAIQNLALLPATFGRSEEVAITTHGCILQVLEQVAFLAS